MRFLHFLGLDHFRGKNIQFGLSLGHLFWAIHSGGKLGSFFGAIHSASRPKTLSPCPLRLSHRVMDDVAKARAQLAAMRQSLAGLKVHQAPGPLRVACPSGPQRRPGFLFFFWGEGFRVLETKNKAKKTDALFSPWPLGS